MQPESGGNSANTMNQFSHLPKTDTRLSLSLSLSLSLYLSISYRMYFGIYLKLATDVQQLPHYMFIYKVRDMKGGQRSNLLNEIKPCRYSLICCFVWSNLQTPLPAPRRMWLMNERRSVAHMPDRNRVRWPQTPMNMEYLKGQMRRWKDGL